MYEHPERRGLPSPLLHTGPTQPCPGARTTQSASSGSQNAGTPQRQRVTAGPTGSGLLGRRWGRRARGQAADPTPGIGADAGWGGEELAAPGSWAQLSRAWRGLALPHLVLRRAPASTCCGAGRPPAPPGEPGQGREGKRHPLARCCRQAKAATAQPDERGRDRKRREITRLEGRGASAAGAQRACAEGRRALPPAARRRGGLLRRREAGGRRCPPRHSLAGTDSPRLDGGAAPGTPATPTLVSFCPALLGALIPLTRCTGNAAEIHLLSESNFWINKLNRILSKRKKCLGVWRQFGRLPKTCYCVTLNFLERNSRAQVWRSHVGLTPVTHIWGMAQNNPFLCVLCSSQGTYDHAGQQLEY